MVNDEARCEFTFRFAKRVEQEAKGIQASSNASQSSELWNKFKVRNIKYALFIGGIKQKSRIRVCFLGLLVVDLM